MPGGMASTGNQMARKLAIMFTDVKGSSKFYKDCGDVAGRLTMHKLNDMLFPIIRSRQGTIVKTIGDSIMAWFPEASGALEAALTMQQTLQAYNQDQPEEKQLLVRIAMNYGYGIIENQDVFGDMINIAGKMVGCCDARQIIISDMFYEEIKNVPDITVVPFSTAEPTDQLNSIKMFTVKWGAGALEDPSGSRYLMSFRLDKRDAGDEAAISVETLLPYIKQGAEKVVQQTPSEINAVFHTLPACLTTAENVKKFIVKQSSGKSDQGVDFKVGLHAVDAGTYASQSESMLFLAAVAARDSGDEGEIIITDLFFNKLDATLQQSCAEKPGAEQSAQRLYSIDPASRQSTSQQPAFLMPANAVNKSGKICFYCGISSHITGACPSKLVQNPTNYLEKLAYIPFSAIKKVFSERIHDIIKPLKSGKAEERFDTLMNDTSHDLFAQAFFSFYEVSTLFQLRTIKKMFLDSSESEHQRGKAGAVMMGIDCMRVSRFDEASEWFQKGIQENPNDHRPHIGLGILSVEQSKPELAFSSFRRAFEVVENQKEKAYIQLLCARVYEIMKDLYNAEEEVKRVLKEIPDWEPALYYYAGLLVKKGKYGKALDTLKDLFEHNPSVYLKTFFNPQLYDIQQKVLAAFEPTLKSMRDASQDSYAAMKKEMSTFSQWLTKDDEGYTKACELFEKATGYHTDECMAGLITLPRMELQIKGLFERAVLARRKNLFKQLGSYTQTIEAYARYVKTYSYRRFITQNDLAGLAANEALLKDAKRSIEVITGANFKKAQELLEKVQAAAEAVAAQQGRLDLIKTLLFIAECSVKMLGFFAVSAGIATVVGTLLLTSIQGITGSLGDDGAGGFVEKLRYGFWIGLITGGIITAVWVKVNFKKWYRRL